MGKDIKIQVNSIDNQVLKSNDKLGITSENLQGKIIFKPEPFVDGVCRMYIEGRGSILMEKGEDCYTLDILSSLLTEPSLDICFKITEPENEKGIPVFCSKIIHFKVLDTIESNEEIPEQYPTWIEIFDSKIAELEALEEDVEQALSDIEIATEEVENLNIDVSDKVDGDVTITLTKKNGAVKTVVLSDGTSLMFQWNGTSLGIKTEDDEEYTYVDLQGIQGPVGPQGEAFQIKKTYSSIEAMNADFYNMQVGDYVMIASTVELEDNAKLYTRGEEQWIFISDFSGAQGIKGETGATPNIQIGTVVSGPTPSVTRSGTNENPVLNFVLEPGPQGIQGPIGLTGNGIASIVKTSTSGLVDTYTITYTNGNTTTFTVTNARSIVSIIKTGTEGLIDTYTITYNDGTTSTFTITNGEDGEVTQSQLDAVQNQVTDIQELIDSELEQGITEKGTRADVSDSAKWYGELAPEGRTEQKQLSGKNLFDINGLDIRGGGVKKTIINDRIVELEAITTTGAQFVGEVIELDSTKNYTFSCKAKKIVCEPTGYSMIRAYLAGSNDGETYTVISRDDIPSPVVNTEYSLVRSFTGYTYLRIYLYNRAESTVVIGEKTQYYDIQLEEGDTATDYEEFVGGTASPSPEYSQEIRNVEGRSCRNLFDGEWTGSVSTNFIPVYAGKNYKYSEHGVAKGMNFRFYNDTSSTEYTTVNVSSSDYYTPEADGYVKLYKTAADKYDCQLEEGTAVTPYEPYFEGKRLEINICNKNLVGGKWFNGLYNADGSVSGINRNYRAFKTKLKSGTYKYSYKNDIEISIVRSVNISENSSFSIANKSFTLVNDAEISLGFRKTDNSEWDIGENLADIEFQLEKGSTATTYVEHQEKMIPFPLANGQKLMEGDYLADDGVHHMRREVVLNGTESWSRVSAGNAYRFVCNDYTDAEIPETTETVGNLLSDKFVAVTAAATSGQTNGIAIASSAKLVIYYDANNTVPTGQFKEWLASNNVKVEYELAEETIESYTEAQQEVYNELKKMMLYYGVNHIWTNTDGLEPDLQLQYYKSNKTRLNNIEARLELLEG